jgi:hypothetical protein
VRASLEAGGVFPFLHCVAPVFTLAPPGLLTSQLYVHFAVEGNPAPGVARIVATSFSTLASSVALTVTPSAALDPRHFVFNPRVGAVGLYVDLTWYGTSVAEDAPSVFASAAPVGSRVDCT